MGVGKCNCDSTQPGTFSMRRLVPFGIIGFTSAALASDWRTKWRQQHSRVSVVSWNLLATPFTTWDALNHRNPDGIIAKPGGVETEAQSHLRYSRAGVALLGKNPHVVMLQECVPVFFSSSRISSSSDLEEDWFK